MNITRAEAQELGRRAAQPVKAPGEFIAVFVHGKLTNPLNGSQWGKSAFAKMRYRQLWHDRVATALFETGWRCDHPAPIRKDVAIMAATHNRIDQDGLFAACKPIVDSLIRCGVIHSDAPDSGHVIRIEQKIDRKQRGVEIHVKFR
jgi:hypothetical protein